MRTALVTQQRVYGYRYSRFVLRHAQVSDNGANAIHETRQLRQRVCAAQVAARVVICAVIPRRQRVPAMRGEKIRVMNAGARVAGCYEWRLLPRTVQRAGE